MFVIGEVIGNFRIVSRLGRGGMGEVFCAEQTTIGTRVAIKMLLPELSKHKDHVDRFFNEALAVGRIKHAGIVKIFDVGVHDGSAYLVMELLEGESLAGRIARAGKMPLGQICDVGRQIASILSATHAQGITHRDLKPDNVFLVPDAELAGGERVKILDFGIAKLTGTMAASGPKTVGAMGTPAYMAPEQWGDSSKVDSRADAYSLGCLVFEMAAGRTPFVAETFAEAFVKHTTEPPPSVRALSPELSAGLPASLDALLVRLLAKKPEDRPAMKDAMAAFEAIGRGEPGALDATITPKIEVATTTSRELPPPPKRGMPVWLFAVAGVVVVGGGIAYVATRPPKPTDAPLPPPPPPAPVVTDPGPPPPPRPPATEQDNPFVDDHGVKLQAHQVSAREYKAFDSAWTGAASDEPVSGVTHAQAKAYCKAMGASLPSYAQWTRAAGGSWGLDPARRGVIGPLEEWTSTEANGYATVAGAYAGMPDDDRQLAMESPMLKAITGTVEETTSAKVGFRCAR